MSLYKQLCSAAAVNDDDGHGLEVLMVSWDEVERDRLSYVNECGMRGLALPHEERKLVHELTLRYDVMHIPTLVVLEISEDGREARVLSRDGRNDVETLFRQDGICEDETTIAPWLLRALVGSPGASKSS